MCVDVVVVVVVVWQWAGRRALQVGDRRERKQTGQDWAARLAEQLLLCIVSAEPVQLICLGKPTEGGAPVQWAQRRIAGSAGSNRYNATEAGERLPTFSGLYSAHRRVC